MSETAVREHQLGLFDGVRPRRVGVRGIVRAPKPRLTHRQAATSYVKRYPQVYDLLLRFAREMWARRQPFGMKLLIERARWECKLNVDGHEEFKLNNSHTSYLARMLIEDCPELESYLEFRKVRS